MTARLKEEAKIYLSTMSGYCKITRHVGSFEIYVLVVSPKIARKLQEGPQDKTPNSTNCSGASGKLFTSKPFATSSAQVREGRPMWLWAGSWAKTAVKPNSRVHTSIPVYGSTPVPWHRYAYHADVWFIHMLASIRYVQTCTSLHTDLCIMYIQVICKHI